MVLMFISPIGFIEIKCKQKMYREQHENVLDTNLFVPPKFTRTDSNL